jgi:hypothetical protein
LETELEETENNPKRTKLVRTPKVEQIEEAPELSDNNAASVIDVDDDAGDETVDASNTVNTDEVVIKEEKTAKLRHINERKTQEPEDNEEEDEESEEG